MKCERHYICCIYLTSTAQHGKENFRGIPKDSRETAMTETVLSGRGAAMGREGLGLGHWPCCWCL